MCEWGGKVFIDENVNSEFATFYSSPVSSRRINFFIILIHATAAAAVLFAPHVIY